MVFKRVVSWLLSNFDILVVILLAMCILFAGVRKFSQKTPSTASVPNTSAGMFVKRQGQNFIVGNQPFVVNGVNDYGLAYDDKDKIAQTFLLLHAAGVTTIRFWLFGDGIVDGFQPQAGKMNEERFEQADYIFAEAGTYGIKLIPVLVNNWTDYGGKDQYIRWAGKDPAKDETIFYTDSKVNSLFKNYIVYVLTRKNTYTHRRYADDPSILAWDIMNEPRSSDQNAMNSWLISMASFMKQYDHQHLVFVGTEVATTQSLSGGESSGVCANAMIAICSVHLYLFNNAVPVFENNNQVMSFLKTQQAFAKQLNKPVLLEEFGIDKTTQPFGQNPLAVMQRIIAEAKQEGYAGLLIWNWSSTPHTSFDFSSDKNEGEVSYSLSDLEQVLHAK